MKGKMDGAGDGGLGDDGGGTGRGREVGQEEREEGGKGER
jgi:hypothetical protein